MSRSSERVLVGTLLLFAALGSVSSARQTSTTTEKRRSRSLPSTATLWWCGRPPARRNTSFPTRSASRPLGRALGSRASARHERHGHDHHDDDRDAGDGDGSQAGDRDAGDGEFGDRSRRERHPHVLGRRHQQAEHHDSSRWQAGRAWRSARGRPPDGDRRHRGAAEGDDRAGRQGIDRGGECSCAGPTAAGSGSDTEGCASRELASDCYFSRARRRPHPRQCPRLATRAAAA